MLCPSLLFCQCVYSCAIFYHGILLFLYVIVCESILVCVNPCLSVCVRLNCLCLFFLRLFVLSLDTPHVPLDIYLSPSHILCLLLRCFLFPVGFSISYLYCFTIVSAAFFSVCIRLKFLFPPSFRFSSSCSDYYILFLVFLVFFPWSFFLFARLFCEHILSSKFASAILLYMLLHVSIPRTSFYFAREALCCLGEYSLTFES